MKKLISGAVVAAALVAAPGANAADLPYKAPPAPVVPAYTWDGFYIGGNAGWAWTNPNGYITDNLGVGPAVFAVPANIAAVNAAGTNTFGRDSVFTGGGQIGYNWQSNAWLIGLEADWNSLSNSQTIVGVAQTTIGPVTLTHSFSTDWLATFRGRLGYIFDGWLVYGTAGLALTDITWSQTFAGAAGGAGGAASGAGLFDQNKWGWTAGGGIERALGGGWSVKAEYLFARFDMPELHYLVNTQTGGFTQSLNVYTDHYDVHMLRAGINYKFGGYGKSPVVAKY